MSFSVFLRRMLATDINTIFKQYKAVIEAELEALLLKNKSKISSTLFDAVEYSVLNGGKRLRAVLSLLTAEAILKSSEPINFEKNPASGLALAVELVHCGSLIHDDLPCMDNDDLRRGKATNHKVYGEAIALLAGDFLLSYPIEVLISHSPGSCLNSEIQIEFISAIKSMIIGQALDLELSQHPGLIKDQILDRNISNLQAMQELKTGALLVSSIRLAAKLAGANHNQVEALSRYAAKVGLAFQIADDILDLSASSEELGKTAGKDINQNKFTFVQEYGMKEAKIKAIELINSAKADIHQIEIYSDKLELVADYVISRNN